MTHAKFSVIGTHPWNGTDQTPVHVHAHTEQGRAERLPLCGFEARGVYAVCPPGDGRPVCVVCSKLAVERGFLDA